MTKASLNLPNILALFRIALAPLMLWFFIDRHNPIFSSWHPSWFDYFAGLIFVIASVTDFFDGFIARNWDQMTKLGGILDPLADKMLVLAGFLGLMAIDRASVWAIFLILSREFFITGLRVVAVSEGKNVSSTMAGKIKTVVQMIAIGFLTMNWPFAIEFLWLAVILTIYSGYEYTRDYFKL
ncbi:CDP-diacylglycerol--glycerol-3-phosphate 3-phosphatidyltransferase [Aliarcobacter butzleri]|jgi:CDP-diacylglycerol--glycerol-3-phosphate 3-phosphatidyltransferase|uniref:CDP-diacylglycerol--glycerol-3-phosphate 3-phosphatidyltransferase n=4 Tax=Aliarcobacter butzleri TaxID=28197 RepID=A0AAW7PYA2_9BACT|nr:CDP-diacylglycerol--glycerol-3-phosphate 3-phosphatidyltransferase [Aliarcobacter butzleri]KLD97671.1 CDP-diacylglycerol--glycerol-3-phosphate 3-phosphatidyltransferase [Aliarcobacter butzleri L348]KLE03136.1 CDP-diacylglycerol--glycerol-3-phosphate 3-phosphatidyltransferase [Aliarcobacter butzleri L352]KLE03537.1 CDP-diacylglycerol--glycerol-3-phosphate 3-phosphatidyltransferase [Aliarcobacter butzleri L353]KLE07902.1 CDP-diacylglycerol--glycerol-3-phosphate 3-phosphatidyltransferase [Aliar